MGAEHPGALITPLLLQVHGLSVVNARIGWFVRNKGEADAMWLAEKGELVDYLAAGSGFSVYLSHDDAGRFYQACVESAPTKGECITTFVTSKQPTARYEPPVDLFSPPDYPRSFRCTFNG